MGGIKSWLADRWRYLRDVLSFAQTRRAAADLFAALREPGASHRITIIVAALLVLAYALGVLGYVLFTPEIGVRCAFSSVANQVYPEFRYPHGVDELKPDDRITRIGDQPTGNWSQLLRALNDLRRHPAEDGDKAALDDAKRDYVMLDGHNKLVRVRFTRGDDPTELSEWCAPGPPPLETIVPSILWFFLKIGLFVVGAVVYWNRGHDRAAAQFFRFVIVSLGAYIGGYHWWRIATRPVLLLVFIASCMLLPAVSLHFYLLFPRPKNVLERHPRRVLSVVYGPPVFFMLLLVSGYLRVRWAAGQSLEPMLLQEMLSEIYVYFGVATAFYLAGIGCLIHSLRVAIDVTERNQVKWILFGSLAALVPIGYTLYLAFLEQGRFGGGAGTWPMFAASACVTLAFTISITRYRLLQLDQIISSGVVYFLISSLFGLVYYGVVFVGVVLVGRLGSEGPSVGQALGAAGAALVIILLLDVARNQFKLALDRRFRREKYQLDRTLHRMRQAIDQLVDPPTLAKRLLQTSAELLGVSSGAVYLRQGTPPLYRLAEALGPAPTLTELSSGCPVVEALASGGAVWARDRRSIPEPLRRQLQHLGGEVAQALEHEGELLGLLVLGPKDAGFYAPDDLTLLTAFARLGVLALVSAEGHRTIESLNRDLQTKVEKIAEQQRRILVLQNQLKTGARVEGRGASDEGPASSPNEGITSLVPRPSTLALPDNVVGSGATVRQLLGLVKKVAASSSAVLLRGESGTGKELLARALHDNSPRAAGPFVKVLCSALAPTLLESELFGHVKGAFTNAMRDKPGRFEAAHGGTLFLDEIGDITLDVQTKLLHVLQEMTFERVGSNEPIRVDVRLIAATHQDLEELIRQGRFREDLFYRLNVFPIRVPPLRERIEDIPELAQHFLRLYGQRAENPVTSIDDDALVILKGYAWPGNIRQLENVIERAVVIAEGSVVTTNELPPEIWETQAGRPPTSNDIRTEWQAQSNGDDSSPVPTGIVQKARLDSERREREHLVRALAASGGNKAEAARALGMKRSTLLSRLKRLGLG
jgi:transcriptional regulator with GAF, ATPase, and Fis domain